MTFDPIHHQTPQQDLATLGDLAACARRDTAYIGNVIDEAVEVGTWAGASALVLAEHMNRVFCVDHWQGPDDPADRLSHIAKASSPQELFAIFCGNMGRRLYRDIFPCFGTSQQYAAIWPRKVALVFLDGTHRYESVAADIKAWLPHVLPGGLLVCHDYHYFPGVTLAVDTSGLEFEHAGTMCWHSVKRE